MKNHQLNCRTWKIKGAINIAATLIFVSSCQYVSAVPANQIISGNARFTVLSPTLIRLEYAADGVFDDAPSFTAVGRDNFSPPSIQSGISSNWLTINTGKIQLRYHVNSGVFASDDLEITLLNGANQVAQHPTWSTSDIKNSGNYGGYYRGLDHKQGPVPMHDGVLSSQGWYLLNDSTTAIASKNGDFSSRSKHGGIYQDGYLFGYANDYAKALLDFKTLTGPAPLLPKKVFGILYSRWHDYSESDYKNSLIPEFNKNNVPLDVLITDTDFKSPNTWDGWEWRADQFPDPVEFEDWVHSLGMLSALNIHPAINDGDPKYNATKILTNNKLALGKDAYGRPAYFFDFSIQNQAQAFLNLHDDFMKQGVDFFWPDWCCDNSQSSKLGVTPDSWMNYLYSKIQHNYNHRPFTLSRIGASYQNYNDATPQGAWADHRYAIHFTGDSDSTKDIAVGATTWPLLSFAIKMAITEGNVGEPYVSHDIGSFRYDNDDKGVKLPDDYYIRWMQAGVFLPIMRIHSGGSARLPWEFSGVAQQQAANMMRLREALVPYIYTMAKISHDTGLPITRPLYLSYPNNAEAIANSTEYMFGSDILVAPITAPGITASATVWFPPGKWIDYFTGESITGPATKNISKDLTKIPVYVRAGGIIPMYQSADGGNISKISQKPLSINVYSGNNGDFSLYDDDGDSQAYSSGKFSNTQFTYNDTRKTLSIGPAQGIFDSQKSNRSFVVNFKNSNPPNSVSWNGVKLKKSNTSQVFSSSGWYYDNTNNTLIVQTPDADKSISNLITIN
ncbi:glycoside hydrolase family 31 protein [Burkholderia alba]|uniref:glycoside hydrolase family 31 protein n=1 Tax=Burkholderia alba TaxID=2683677 RepID=UPI002B05ACA2|nr:TIM-barrel domain-containing protein [Burkholderia alba]